VIVTSAGAATPPMNTGTLVLIVSPYWQPAEIVA